MNLTYLKIVPKWRSSGMKLFDKIRILRKARGLSQEQLGYSLSRVNKDGISRQTVSDWENGKFEPKLENIRDLAEVFNVSFDALLDESVDLENEKVLEAVLNKRPYDNRDGFEEEQPVVEDVPSTFKSKRVTSWRTAILMAISVSMLLTGISWLYNFIDGIFNVNYYTSMMGMKPIYAVIIYGVIAFTILGLSGVAFGFGLNAALRKKESRKAVVVLLIVLLALFTALNLCLNISSIVNYTKLYIQEKNSRYGSDSIYAHIIPEYWFSLVLTLLENIGMLVLVIWAHKKLAAEKNEFKQVY